MAVSSTFLIYRKSDGIMEISLVFLFLKIPLPSALKDSKRICIQGKFIKNNGIWKTLNNGP